MHLPIEPQYPRHVAPLEYIEAFAEYCRNDYPDIDDGPLPPGVRIRSSEQWLHPPLTSIGFQA